MPRRTALALGAGAGLVTCAALAVRSLRGRFVAYEVEGESMLPALRPGDWVVVDRRAPQQAGAIVLTGDPRAPERAIVKRIAGFDEGRAWLLGDNPSASTDSRMFGSVPRSALEGAVRWRYWPPPLGTVH